MLFFQLIFSAVLSFLRMKKSVIKIAAIGAKTDPIRYKKFSNFVMGTKTASTIPMMQTITPAHFSLIFFEILTVLTPAE
ncbi:hypothetical protein SDC9_205259 [bioreactor metagenome]|uniref:Uncharacterized protein n=1 Tax=bioreactor metagenome TaxID=1076179 RepID=A0A645J1K4_9ZZZZ